jgi:preprotein translocase subunit SecB
MEAKKNIQFALEQLTLISVHFNRANIISFGDNERDKLEHGTTVNVDRNPVKENKFGVVLTVNHVVKFDKEDIVNIEVKYVGNYSIASGEPSEDEIETFSYVNAPAIIFPFVREVIASLTSKALIGAILIQPVNFLQMHLDRKKEKG